MKQEKERGFYSSMLRLALPIAFQQLLTTCAQLVDTAMVIGLGTTETAAIGVAQRWGFLINLIIFGVSSGSSALIAQFWGARDIKKIRNTFGLAMIFSLVFGLFYTLSAMFFPTQLMSVFTDDPVLIREGAIYLRSVALYGVFCGFTMSVSITLRATEDVITPLICSIVSICTNTVLNYILIYGKFGAPKLGLRGAAIATVIAMAVQAVLIWTVAYVRKRVTRASPREIFLFDAELVRRFIKTALPVVLNEGLWAAGTNVYSMVLARMGNSNYAAYTMFNSLEQLAFIFFVGLCHACAIMVGKTIGSGQIDGAYRLAKRFLKITPMLAIICGLALIVLRDVLLGILPTSNQEPEVVATASKLLMMYGFWFPVRMFPYMFIVGIFRAGGDTKIGMLYDIVTVYFLAIPVVAVMGLVLHAPFTLTVFAIFVSEDLIKIVLCSRRFASKKWIKQLNYSHEQAS